MLNAHAVSFGGLSKEALLDRLRASDVQLNAAALALFGHPGFTTSPARSTARVVHVSVASLGFPGGATFEALVEQAKRLGLALCPLELGPHLRLALPEQAEGFVGQPPSRGCAPPGSITVASAPLDEDDEVPKGFYLRRIEGALWLRGYRSWPGHLWSPQDGLAFVEAGCRAASFAPGTEPSDERTLR